MLPWALFYVLFTIKLWSGYYCPHFANEKRGRMYDISGGLLSSNRCSRKADPGLSPPRFAPPGVSILSFEDRAAWSWCRQSALHAGGAHQWWKNKSLTVCSAVPLERQSKHIGEDLRTGLPKFSSDYITSKLCDNLGQIISTLPPLSGKRGWYYCLPHIFVGIKESMHARHLE